MRAWTFAVVFVVFLAQAGTATAVMIADRGRTEMTIRLADDALPAERTAARELSTYLERATGVAFPILSESDAGGTAPAIHVGLTRFSEAAGVPPDLAEEEWVLRTEGAHLIVTGGRPRGTLYAVYRLLEDHVGVRWWTAEAEHVPRHQRLELADLDRRGQPAFTYRDVSGPRGSPEFLARNRVNGHFTFLTREHGGRHAYGPPFHAHTFYRYVVPEEQFAVHPEFFSEVDGRRTHDHAQLCLTDLGLLEFFSSRLMENIEAARAAAAATGEAPPQLFTISPNDWGGACECERCMELLAVEGSRSGALTRFVNRLAERVALRYPDVLLNTLAYYHTYDPPLNAALGDNVVVRLSALQSRDFIKPVTSRRHREYRRNIDIWRTRTRHLRIWDYTVTFGSKANLPLPNWSIMQQDLDYYRDHGVEGMYVQHNLPVTADLWDLKLWLLMKLLEDPDRDVNVMIREFTDGYYGPAGGVIRRYMAELERVSGERRSSIRYRTRSWMFRYLDARFLLEAQDLFDRAAERVRDDPVLLGRVQEARISLDRATVLRWTPKLGRGLKCVGPDGLGSSPLDPNEVVERYFLHAFARIESRLTPELRRERHERLEDETVRFLKIAKESKDR